MVNNSSLRTTGEYTKESKDHITRAGGFSRPLLLELPTTTLPIGENDSQLFRIVATRIQYCNTYIDRH